MWQILTKTVTIFLSTTLRKPQDLTKSFQDIYGALEQPGKVQYQIGAVRLSLVSPRVNGSDPYPHHIEPDHSNDKKPIAIYLPGLDGYGVSAYHQMDDLAEAFQFWRVTILPEDRSSFTQIIKTLTGLINQVTNNNNKEKVILIGESCGGLLATALALRLDLQGLVLVNPATSFDQTVWDRVVPILASIGYRDSDEARREGLTPYSILGSLLLSTLIPDNDQLRRIIDTIFNLEELDVPPRNLDQVRDVWQATMTSFKETEDRLPPELLEHRVTQWLTVGTPIINQRLEQVQSPTLIIVGQEDRLLPSSGEAERLLKALPMAEAIRVRNRGHFVLDENFNLTEAILYSNIDPFQNKQSKKRYDVITDWKLPPSDVVQSAIERTVQPFRTAHSPVFFSTDSCGKRWRGLTKLPDTSMGPLVFVGNHQFAAADLRMLFAQLLQERGVVARGLAHPINFVAFKDKPGELSGRTPGILDANPVNGDFQQFGAVEVNPRNYYRLLQSGQNVLLFPGGAKEAFSGRNDYPLFWPDKVDFVRTAARFNATIVPFSAVGMLESVNVIAEPQQLMNVPFVRDRVRAMNENVTAARYDQKSTDEMFGFPLAFPKLPARNYFLFGKPIDLNFVDPMDKVACAKAYRQAEYEVRKGLDDLLRARERDPFLSTPRRLAYERVLGKSAPTFPVEELN